MDCKKDSPVGCYQMYQISPVGFNQQRKISPVGYAKREQFGTLLLFIRLQHRWGKLRKINPVGFSPVSYTD